MSRINIFVFSPLILIILFSCATWQDPNTAVASRELSIANILEIPIVYDSSGVTVEGMIWDLNYDLLEDEEMEVPFTTFKLADRDGNYINVFAEGNFPLIEGENVRVTGIYRRDLTTKYRNYVNEIEAKTIHLEATSTLYRIYRYIR